MTTIDELHLASAIGPATREQLRQRADEHDRMWDRKNRVRRIRFGVLLFAIAALVGAACKYRLHISRIGTWYGSHVDFGTLVIEGAAIGLFATAMADRMALPRSRPFPWRPIDLTPADLEEQNTDFPGRWRISMRFTISTGQSCRTTSTYWRWFASNSSPAREHDDESDVDEVRSDDIDRGRRRARPGTG